MNFETAINRIVLRALVIVCFLGGAGAVAQQGQPAAANPPAQGRGGGRGGGIPNVTPEQAIALMQFNTDLAPHIAAVTSARQELIGASLALPRNDPNMRTRTDAIRVAERNLANARADGLARLQASDNKLSADQLAALAAAGGTIQVGGAGRGGGGGRGAVGASGGRGAGNGGRGGAANGGRAGASTLPHMTTKQEIALSWLNWDLNPKMQALTAARNDLGTTALTLPRNDAAIASKLDAVIAAEMTVATARADGLAKLQASAEKLDAEQLTAFATMNGAFSSGGLQPPFAPGGFEDHAGYVSIFDGVSLKGWDGNPKFWRVEDGAIVGESTPTNPSGNTYIAYRGVEAHDFDFKCEIKVEGSGGSGIQYRSKTGLPWLSGISPALGPVNLGWMMTGPQADFWPAQIYSGQFYSENTPMRIMSPRGDVVEGYGFGPKHLVGSIGDTTELAKMVKMNDWNQYMIIARGGVFIHILNGQLMAVMVDDDPDSSNNWSGQFGIEIEATTKVSVRNMWLKKLN